MTMVVSGLVIPRCTPWPAGIDRWNKVQSEPFYRVFEAYADDPATALDKARENAANYEAATELEATELDSRTGWTIRRGPVGLLAVGKATIRVKLEAGTRIGDLPAVCLWYRRLVP
ncbi:hypothetical protein ACQPXS_46810 (plasmid) [Streptomyces sp. CA-142005]|uniref:hypothetical protein n=1 Tax=Streptomyces sp. CA-142005 TaxID=3240052 RepID=UPI003D8A03D0